MDALNTAANAMARFVAPVTLLATGGAGQVLHLSGWYIDYVYILCEGEVGRAASSVMKAAS